MKRKRMMQCICMLTILLNILFSSSAEPLIIKKIEITPVEEIDLWLCFTYKKDEVPDFIKESWLYRFNHYEELSNSIEHMSDFCYESYNLNLWESCIITGSIMFDLMNYHIGEMPLLEYQSRIFEASGNMGISYMKLGNSSEALPYLQQVIYMLHHWDNRNNDNHRTPEEDVFIEWIMLYYEHEAYLLENDTSRAQSIVNDVEKNKQYQKLYQQKEQYQDIFEELEPNPFTCYEELLECVSKVIKEKRK